MFTYNVGEIGHLINLSLELSEEEEEDLEGCLSPPDIAIMTPAFVRGWSLRHEHARRAPDDRGAQRTAGPMRAARDRPPDGVLFIDRLDKDARKGSDEVDPRVRLVQGPPTVSSARTTVPSRCDLMRLVFAGTPSAAVPSLTALIESSHEVVAVVTRPDAPAADGQELLGHPVPPSPTRTGSKSAHADQTQRARFRGGTRQPGSGLHPVVAYGA